MIEHTHHEFTSLCPMTGHPDFADITVRYVADKKCVELKSLKLYFHAYRNEGMFFEAATNRICDDLGAALKPRSLAIIANWPYYMSKMLQEKLVLDLHRRAGSEDAAQRGRSTGASSGVDEAVVIEVPQLSPEGRGLAHVPRGVEPRRRGGALREHLLV